MKLLFTLALAALSVGVIAHDGVGQISAQDSVVELEPELSLPEKNAKKLKKLEFDFGKMGALNITGYLQGQWQWSESAGAAAFADGGSFASASNNRFMLRRGRIKFTYKVGAFQVVFQPDFTEKGVSIKDAYLAVASKSNIIGGQLGIFDRPFGYEISYSSSLRESPERSRVFLSLFPGERDLGAMLNLKYGEFTLNAGMFNGNGIGAETDSNKDFIGRLAWLHKWNNGQVGAAFSYYAGAVISPVEKHYAYQKGVGFQEVANEKYAPNLRQYFGVAAQYLQMWGAGTTNIRGEVLWGNQPGTFKNNNDPSGSSFGAGTEPIYRRNFVGAYAILVQDIGRSKHSIVLKYDYYDPNTAVSGNDIGKLQGTGAADIAYSTFGVGYLFRWNQHIRLMAYYDMVDNEKSDNLKGFNGRIKQNVFTARVQFKF